MSRATTDCTDAITRNINFLGDDTLLRQRHDYGRRTNYSTCERKRDEDESNKFSSRATSCRSRPIDPPSDRSARLIDLRRFRALLFPRVPLASRFCSGRGLLSAPQDVSAFLQHFRASFLPPPPPPTPPHSPPPSSSSPPASFWLPAISNAVNSRTRTEYR